MCLILFAYKMHSEYPFVVAANRDEYYQRPSLSANWWPEQPYLLAGKDLEGGGTWMGITRTGRFAAITNVREGSPTDGNFLSRGELPLAYLNNQYNENHFNRYLQNNKSEFRGYNLIYGTPEHLQFFSNRSAHIENLPQGIYGLSNATLNTPWPKVVIGKERLANHLQENNLEINVLFDILSDETIPPDHELPDTGITPATERLLSATCIKGERYGTRSSSVLLIGRHNNVELYEKERAPSGGPIKKFSFKIESDS